ncbi:MAG: DAK2 domain-containing protein [Acidimicrobiales bacterium]|nr:DAK2 domain-containing protein [Acidimicrobiales bacterium]
MIASSLNAAGLRDVMGSFRDALVAHRPNLNLLNVYPVPDGDTGSNMTMTLESVCEDLEALGATADMVAVAKAIAHGSLMGARGNSGVILSQVLRGLSATFSHDGPSGGAETVIDGRLMADGLTAAASAAYGAVMTPVEGTILTVVREAAEAAVLAANDGADLLNVVETARAAGGESLARTPELLPVLADAGVVDAGGSGFLLLLDAVLTTVDGRPLPEPTEAHSPVLSGTDHHDHKDGGDQGSRYEVMCFLDAPDGSVEGFKEAWAALGDSVVVVGGDGVWNCHVHTSDIGAAIEAGIAVGRPHQIRVTDLFEEVQEQAWVRDHMADNGDVGEPVACAVVAVATGPGIRDIFRSLGVRRIVLGGQSMNPSTADLLAAVEEVPADDVVLLPNNGNVIAVAEQVDAQTEKTVRVVPTQGITEGFASLLEYDPHGTADENLMSMTAAAGTVVAGEITVAVRDSSTDVGAIAAGDHIGLMGGTVRVVAESAIDAITKLLSLLVGEENEIVTVITGEDADESTTAAVVAWLGTHHPDLEVEIHDGGQPLYPYYLGVE